MYTKELYPAYKNIERGWYGIYFHIYSQKVNRNENTEVRGSGHTAMVLRCFSIQPQ